MSVRNSVQYDCNVKLKNDTYGPSTTIVMDLPDGLEDHPDTLEQKLFEGVLKRLKIVVSRMPVARTNLNPLCACRVDISTDRGYRLGQLSITVPFSIGWDRTEVDLNAYPHASEVEGYLAQWLKTNLAIRVNQRTPPLPRGTSSYQEMVRLFHPGMFPQDQVARYEHLARQEKKLELPKELLSESVSEDVSRRHGIRSQNVASRTPVRARPVHEGAEVLDL